MRDITAVPPVQADARIPYGHDANQFFDLWRGTSRDTVMMIHGGFWRAKYDLSHASHLCAALAKLGPSVANIEYRRVGNDGGGWPGTYADIVAAFKALAHQFRGSKIVAMGHSAGGHLALRLAIDAAELSGVVALAPAAVLNDVYELHLSNDAVVEFMGGTPQAKQDAYELACPSRHSSVVRRILLHGTADDVVPISISRHFKELRRADENVELLELPEVDHFALIDPETETFKVVAREVKSLLKSASAQKS